MPEGDSIHRAAALLRPALAGSVLERFEAPRMAGARPRVGELVESVEATGKHLLIRFSGGLTLDTHLRMTGAWHLYREGERWRKPPHLVRCLVGVPEWNAVCFSAPVVRMFPTRATGTVEDPTSHLGPDLTGVDLGGVDAEGTLRTCLERMAALDGSTPVGEVMLDQRVASGVGNIYKCEVCWHLGVDPFAPLAAIDEVTRARLLTTASRLLRANLGPGPRRTVAGGLAVYGRRGSPCRRCGTQIRSDVRGELARVTYWCPTCQRSATAGPPGPAPRQVNGQ